MESREVESRGVVIFRGARGFLRRGKQKHMLMLLYDSRHECSW